MKMHHFLFLLCFLAALSFTGSAQSAWDKDQMQVQVKQYNEKINELIGKNEKNGFHVLMEKKLPMKNQLETVLMAPLYEGNWYHFCFIGDPSSEKIRTSMFLEGFGDLVQDRIIVRREHEFWTEFSFMCPQTGRYEFTFFQRSPMSNPLSYFVVLQKDAPARGTE